MSNLPNTSRSTFDASKRYFSGAQQQGQPYFDWDLNEKFDHVRWWVLKLGEAIGESGRITLASGANSFNVTAATVPGNNLKVAAGVAIINGRLIVNDAALEYNDSSNFIATGTVSTKTEIVPAVTYKVTDIEKLWTTGYSLPGCRFKFTSGALSGDSFLITGLVGQSITVSGDISTAAVSDTYIILPPEITTPNEAVPSAKTYYLVSWWEDISPEEDTALEDPAYQLKPSHRNKLRFVIHKDWAGAASTDPMSGHMAIPICDVTRSAADAAIDAADITNASNFISGLSKLTSDLTAAEANLTAVDVRLTAVEATINPVIDLLEYQHASNEGIFFTTDYTTANIVYGTGKLYSRYKAASVVDPNVFSIAGATIANTDPDTSYIAVSVPPSDDSFTIDLKDSAIQIDDEDVALATFYADTSPFNIKRSFPMADRPDQKGFDWILDGTTIFINPGWAHRWGTLYQKVGQDNLDVSLAGNWIEGTQPSNNTWAYIYMQVQAGRRDLLPILSNKAPKWNGEHPTTQAFMVGIFHYDSNMLAQVCRGGKRVYFDAWGDNTQTLVTVSGKDGGWIVTNGTFELFNSTSTYYNSSAPDLPPEGATSLGLIVEYTNIVSTEVTFQVRSEESGIDFNDTGTLTNTGPSRAWIHLPMLSTIGFNISTSNTLNEIKIYLHYIEFDPLYTPDVMLWRT